MILAIRNDHAVRAAHPDAQGLHVHAFIANAHATEAQNATRGIVINQLGPFFFRPVNFFFDEAARIRAVAEHHVLQFALAALAAPARCRFERSCLRWRSACTPSATWALFPLPPCTCGMPLAAKAQGSSKTKAPPCRCAASLQSPASLAAPALRAR